MALFKQTLESLRVSPLSNTRSSRRICHKNVTSKCHKRKYIHHKPPEDYIRIYNNAPPGVPYSRLFQDKREYAYFRCVISRWKRGRLRKPMSQKGHPLTALPGSVQDDVDVHHTPWHAAVLPHWIAQLRDTVRSQNRNGQLVYRDPEGYFTLVGHKNGSVQFAPYLNVKTAWERLEAYLKACWGDDRAKLFMESLHKSGVKTHIAVHTPGVTQFHVKIPGIATIEGDRTPWRDGTTEVIVENDLMNTVHALQEALKGINWNQRLFSENEAYLAKKLESLMALIEEARTLVRTVAQAQDTHTSGGGVGTGKPTQVTTPATDSPSSVLIRIQTPHVSDCVHGWTVETVIRNYSNHVTCDECLRCNSCSVLREAYESSKKQK